ncbi:hypothetical protein KZP23_14545 [Echinicola marina]|uniref:hypothetical protein n=1 Tax=Echinicola marina TaxID=2859768 RepID=UPI001CF65185|nr:hypothetical protein [Echinicola marina]UCS91942.1 hypothetical protein KZP23_14545 [Echinicola marina]
MKNFAITLLLILFSLPSFSQQENEVSFYQLRPCIPKQDTVYMKTGEKKVLLKEGWTVTEEKAGITVQRVLEKDTVISIPQDIPVKVTSKWKIGEVKHTDDTPGKLYLNPYHFTSSSDTNLNHQSYLPILENGYVRLLRHAFKWSAITIPFAIRPALNDTIGSKATTDLKLGASISYNLNWETFKNRRFKAKKNAMGIAGGLGFGLSKVSLNASSTSLSDSPYVHEEDGLAFFLAPGVGLNIRGFQLNFSYAWDIPLTHNVKDWNYANKGYYGIGLGVNLDGFGK